MGTARKYLVKTHKHDSYLNDPSSSSCMFNSMNDDKYGNNEKEKENWDFSTIAKKDVREMN